MKCNVYKVGDNGALRYSCIQLEFLYLGCIFFCFIESCGIVSASMIGRCTVHGTFLVSQALLTSIVLCCVFCCSVNVYSVHELKVLSRVACSKS